MPITSRLEDHKSKEHILLAKNSRILLYKERIVDIDIFTTFRNSEKEIAQHIRLVDLPREWWNGNSSTSSHQYLQNTYRKDINWLHYSDELRVQEKQQVQCQQTTYYVAYPISKKLLGAPALTWQQYIIQHCRPWHDTQAIARTCTITSTNQEKGGLHAWWKARPNIKLRELISPV